MKEYEKILGKNNPMQNAIAFSYLLENGRKSILNDDLYNKAIKEAENDTSNPLMTPSFQKEFIKISRDMANMKEQDLRNYIFDRVKAERKAEKNR